MKKVLDKSGRKTELIELEKEGHSGWTADNEVRSLIDASIQFLWKHLGPGYGVSSDTGGPAIALRDMPPSTE